MLQLSIYERVVKYIILHQGISKQVLHSYQACKQETLMSAVSVTLIASSLA